MRKEIRDLIKRAYPTNKYEERNKTLLDKYLKPGTIKAIERRLGQIPQVDMYRPRCFFSPFLDDGD